MKRDRPPEIPYKNIQVWSAEDFSEAAKKIDRLSDYLLQFSFLLQPFHPVNQDDLIYNRLCAEPPIQSALRRLRKGQKTSPEEPR